MYVTCLMKTQMRLEAFYTFNERFAKIRSKRIKKAVKGITGNQTSELMEHPLQEVSRSRKKRRVNPAEPGDNKTEKPSNEIEGGDVGSQGYHMDKSLPKHSRKRRNSGVSTPSIPPMEAEGRRSCNRGSHGNVRGGGGGRGNGLGRGRGKRSSNFEPREISNGDTDDDEQEVLVENLEVPDKVRRVSYSLYLCSNNNLQKYPRHGVTSTKPFSNDVIYHSIQIDT